MSQSEHIRSTERVGGAQSIRKEPVVPAGREKRSGTCSTAPRISTRLIQADPPVPEYAVELVEGVTEHRSRLDELLSAASTEWSVDRMPPVDRNLLRIAIYELLWCDGVPDAVAISEAVELAKDLSTDESPRFVNGLLGRLQLLKAELVG